MRAAIFACSSKIVIHLRITHDVVKKHYNIAARRSAITLFWSRGHHKIATASLQTIKSQCQKSGVLCSHRSLIWCFLCSIKSWKHPRSDVMVFRLQFAHITMANPFFVVERRSSCIWLNSKTNRKSNECWWILWLFIPLRWAQSRSEKTTNHLSYKECRVVCADLTFAKRNERICPGKI